MACLLRLTNSEMIYFALISRLCDPHGNGHTPPQELKAVLVVFVASSKREAGR